MSKVRSSELEIGLSSSDKPVEGDTAVSAPREVRAFHALEEECRLDNETLSRGGTGLPLLPWGGMLL